MERPNILLITSDQHRGDCLGISGNPVLRTPNLDALGRSGRYFANAFSPMPVCVPARYTIMTGRLPYSWGMRGNGGVIPEGTPTLPALLSAHGYRTALIGKAHFSGPPAECERLNIPAWRYPYGFDEMLLSEEGRQWASGGDDYQTYLRKLGWSGYERAHGIGNNDPRSGPSALPEEHYHTTWCARESIEWIRRHRSQFADRPFFLWCSFVKPHSPYDPPEPWDRIYSPREVPPPIGDARDLRGLSPYYLKCHYERHVDAMSPEAILRSRAFYYGLVAQIDHEVGRIVRALDELGIRRDTVVMFCSDHGDLLGDHGLFFKSNFFRGSWHVPMLLSWPGRIEPGPPSERLVTLADVAPTLLELAGVEAPGGLHGTSLLDDESDRPMIFGSLLPKRSAIHAVRTKEWQYVFHTNGGLEELYDLRRDRDERENLAAGDRCRQVRLELRRALGEHLKEVAPEFVTSDGDLAATELDWPEFGPVPSRLGLRPY